MQWPKLGGVFTQTTCVARGCFSLLYLHVAIMAGCLNLRSANERSWYITRSRNPERAVFCLSVLRAVGENAGNGLS